MKKRSSAVAAFVLVAVLCLSVGFAALTDDLFIGGTAAWDFSAAEEVFDAQVYWTDPDVDGNFAVSTANGVKTESITATRGADSNGEENDKLSITVAGDAFAVAGQIATIKAKVQNDSTDAIKVTVNTPASADTTNGYFKVTVVGADNIAAGETGDVTITIELLKTAGADVENEEFNFTLTATSVK